MVNCLSFNCSNHTNDLDPSPESIICNSDICTEEECCTSQNEVQDKDCIGYWSPCNEDCLKTFNIIQQKSGRGEDCSYLENDTYVCTGGHCCDGIICQEPSSTCKHPSTCIRGSCTVEENMVDGIPCNLNNNGGTGVCLNGECIDSIPDIDCVGEWSSCNQRCKKTHTITTFKSGDGTSCMYGNNEEMPCSPGEGECSSSFMGSLCNSVCEPSKECVISECGPNPEIPGNYHCIETNKENNTPCSNGKCKYGECETNDCPEGCPEASSECKIAGECIPGGGCTLERNKTNGSACKGGICSDGICSSVDNCNLFNCSVKDEKITNHICIDNKCTESQCCKGNILPDVKCKDYIEAFPCIGEDHNVPNELAYIKEDGSTNCCSDLTCDIQEFCYSSSDRCVSDIKNNILVKECTSTKLDGYEVEDGVLTECKNNKRCIYESDFDLPDDGSLVKYAYTVGDSRGIFYTKTSNGNIHLKAPVGMVIEFITKNNEINEIKYRTNNRIIIDLDKYLENNTPPTEGKGFGSLYYKDINNKDWSHVKNEYFARAICTNYTCDQDCTIIPLDCGDNCEGLPYIIDIPQSGNGKPCPVIKPKFGFMKYAIIFFVIFTVLIIITLLIKKGGRSKLPKMPPPVPSSAPLTIPNISSSTPIYLISATPNLTIPQR